jgi:hypothetical protein
LKGSEENVQQQINRVRHDATEKNHALKENMGEQISRVKSRLHGLLTHNERKADNINCQVNELRTQLSQVEKGKAAQLITVWTGSVGSNSSHQQVASGHIPPASTEIVNKAWKRKMRRGNACCT